LSYRRENFKKRYRRALEDEFLQEALERATTRFKLGRSMSFEEIEDVEALRRRGKEIKENALAHLDVNLGALATRVEEAGGKVFWAHTGEEACKYIANLADEKGVKLAVKSKSMTSEEIDLNHTLSRVGVEAVETDLGEYIVQLAGEMPSHLLAPAIHKTKEQVAELFSNKFGEKYPADIGILTQAARKSLRQKFLNADMGISGANFAVAETGTIVIITNEGNGRLVTSLPRIHVAVVGIEKVIPALKDLAVLLKLLIRSAAGQKISSYVTMVTGPRREWEVDGPEEFHLVLLDNGRTSILGSEYREALHCLRCGACLNVCPVYGKIGGHAYGWVYPGPIGSVLTPLYKGLKEYGDLPHASTLCGACLEVCPVMIDIPEMLVMLRRDEAEQKRGGVLERLAFKLWGYSLGSESKYKRATGLARALLSPFNRKGAIARAPYPLSRWARERDFPPLSDEPFRSRWADLVDGEKPPRGTDGER
jgi:L-lactate dehydrogenase complex protein LldF